MLHLDFDMASTATTRTTPTLVVPVAAPMAAPAALRSSEAFLKRLAAGEGALIDAPLPLSTTSTALKFLRQLYTELPTMPAPTVAAAPGGVVGFTWENRRDHLNAQVFADGRVELFHEDLLSRVLWDEDGEARPSDAFYDRALRFCR